MASPGDVLELRRLFWHPHSALIIGGLDGMTTDILGFLEFLSSVEHKYPMEIFIIEHGDLRLQISSLELQYTLQEHANEMLQGPTLLLKAWYLPMCNTYFSTIDAYVLR
jgi:hypothetical protein